MSMSKEKKSKKPKDIVDELTEEVDDLNIGNSDGEDTKQGGDQTPENKSKRNETEKGARKKLSFSPEVNKGELIEGDPWDSTPMRDKVDESSVYTVSNEWKTSGKVDLGKIYQKLPAFVKEIRGKTCRQELEEILKKENGGLVTTNILQNPSPHVKEIVDKQRPKDKPSLPEGEQSFKAYSLPPEGPPPEGPPTWFLDCEYMCKVHLPGNTSHWLDHSDKTGKRIRAVRPDKIKQRWIFIPSFRRAQIALLDWPKDDIMTPENTIRILVVRPTEFQEYVKYCGHEFHIISLPNDEIGAGYPRLWIQKFALRLKLEFIWMIDDSVECFYEYHSTDGEGTKYAPERRRKFSLVFQDIEGLVQNAKSNPCPIAAMSPRRFRGPKPELKDLLAPLPPRMAVYLNLEALKSKDIYYRPELQVLEDMVFAYECEQNGLRALTYNRFHLQDKRWTDTGARSSSVQQKMKESNEKSDANTTG
ncbi:uncharacterized protein LOC113678749 [Pocillopora damicornis]|uniref:uncharacterized protein LOC113678749 n=1 Tax=Pocillopora damicornis TaxID=46731 RepID=UPI000F5589AA|nr:uncharacterized protein LOC113678749 [Pocillopora damicornis]